MRGRSNAYPSTQTPSPFDPASRLFDTAQAGGAPVTVERPWRINGFEGEIEEAMRCIAAGKIESDVMLHEETRQPLAWMDQIRREVGCLIRLMEWRNSSTGAPFWAFMA